MQKVTSVNLNGNAYQLDESGYETLREYLARAEGQLQDNPDRAEIMADLEQAIADKCQRYLGPHKTVVTASEMSEIVAEMGPVNTAAESGEAAGESAPDEKKTAGTQTPPRRIYRLLDGAMVAGVCNGIAAYFHVDVTIVRIAFVVVALLTKGVGIIAYIALMFVLPEANTPESRAAVAGPVLTAKEVVDRVKKQYAEGEKEWRRQWRQQRRQWRRGWPPAAPLTYGPPPLVAVLLPVFGLVHVALFLVMAAMMISLVNTGAILDWDLPPDVPVWAAALILLIGYQIAVSPLRLVRHWAPPPQPGVQPGWFAFWNAVTWLVGLAFVVWIASDHVPEIREFLQRLPELFRDFIDAIRDVVAER